MMPVAVSAVFFAIVVVALLVAVLWLETRCVWCGRKPAARRCSWCRLRFCEDCWRSTRHGDMLGAGDS